MAPNPRHRFFPLSAPTPPPPPQPDSPPPQPTYLVKHYLRNEDTGFPFATNRSGSYWTYKHLECLNVSLYYNMSIKRVVPAIPPDNGFVAKNAKKHLDWSLDKILAKGGSEPAGSLMRQMYALLKENPTERDNVPSNPDESDSHNDTDVEQRVRAASRRAAADGAYEKIKQMIRDVSLASMVESLDIAGDSDYAPSNEFKATCQLVTRELVEVPYVMLAHTYMTIIQDLLRGFVPKEVKSIQVYHEEKLILINNGGTTSSRVDLILECCTADPWGNPFIAVEVKRSDEGDIFTTLAQVVAHHLHLAAKIAMDKGQTENPDAVFHTYLISWHKFTAYVSYVEVPNSYLIQMRKDVNNLTERLVVEMSEGIDLRHGHERVYFARVVVGMLEMHMDQFKRYRKTVERMKRKD